MGAALRKLRGLIGLGLTWAVAWGTLMALVGIIVGIVDPDSIDAGEGPLRIGAIVGFQGFVAGVVFGLLLSFAETRRTILDLSLGRMALWGFLASAALPLLSGLPPTMLYIICPLGAACAAASVAIARRAELRQPEPRQQLGSTSLPV